MEEKITSNSDIGILRDHIPLEWKYTAGVAGERFLQLLRQGKIQASVCKSCCKSFLPPKIFCKDCFVQATEWKDVPENSGYLYSFTKAKRSGSEGYETIALVKFEGIEGGLLGKLREGRGEELKIGTKVKPVFRPKDKRRGELSDIEYFEKA